MEQTFLERIEKQLKKLNSIARKNFSDNRKGDLVFMGRYSKNNILFGVQVITAFATVLALAFTYNALNRADRANDIAQKSLDSSSKSYREIMTFTKQKEIADNEHQRIIDSLNNVKDSLNKKAIEKSLEYAKINSDASNDLSKQSIKALQEAQTRFQLETQPYLEIINPVIATFKSYAPLDISYEIKNLGSQNVKIFEEEVGVIFVVKNKIDVFSQNPYKYIKPIKPMSSNTYISKESPKKMFFNNDKTSGFINYEDYYDVLNDKKIICFYGTYIYFNFITNKKRMYRFIIVVKGQVDKITNAFNMQGYEYLYNDNVDILENEKNFNKPNY